MTEAMPISEARQKFLTLVDEVASGLRKILVTKHGRPAAVLMGADEYFRMRETLDLLLRSADVTALSTGLAALQGPDDDDGGSS